MHKKPFVLASFLHKAINRRAFVAVLALFMVLSLPGAAHAQAALNTQNLQETGAAAGVSSGTGDLMTIIGRIINIALGFIGVVFLVLMLYAGYLWMTAAGDPEKVKKAQHTIRNSLIGLVIIVSAWAIVSFILNLFATQLGGGLYGGTTQPLAPFSVSPGAACLGKGIIDMQLPDRNATDVPRNSPIIVTFKKAIKPESLMSDWTEAASTTKAEFAMNSTNVVIYRTKDGPTGALNGDKVKVRYTKDLKTFVFKPVDYLGNASNNTDYTVLLIGGKSGVLLSDGSPAITCSPTNQYAWQFQVSTVVDLTPPTVTTVVPWPGGLYARNIVVQINFSKAMDPTAAQGKTSDGFSNIDSIATPTGTTQTTDVQGEYRISNQYKTVEFVTDVKCGTNSCGRDIFCLPAHSAIQVTAKAASLDGPGPQAAFTTNGYDGLVSVVGNSLDGSVLGGDGKADGPPKDNYIWTFGTSDDIKLSPPAITFTTPDSNPQTGKNSNVPLDQLVQANFDSFLQSSTLNTDNVTVDAHGKTDQPDTFWWEVGMKMIKADGSEADLTKIPPEVPTAAALFLKHRAFLPSGTYPNLNYYDPYIMSDVQDAYQNCFNPARQCGDTINVNCCAYRSSSDDCSTILHK